MAKPDSRTTAQAGATARGQQGLGLVETLVAVAILGTSVAAFVAGLSAGTIAVNEHDGEAIARGLAQSQLEYAKSYGFDPGAATYPLLPGPEGYSVAVGVSAAPGGDANLQKITVTVTRTGDPVITLEGYKVNR